MMTTRKMPQTKRQSELLEEFFVLAGPLVGRTTCFDHEILPVIRFVLDHLGFFRAIVREPSDDRELCARRWVNELASAPPRRTWQSDAPLSRLRYHFSLLPRPKNSMILSPIDDSPKQTISPVTRILT